MVAGDGIEGREVIVEQRRAIGAVGIHRKMPFSCSASSLPSGVQPNQFVGGRLLMVTGLPGGLAVVGGRLQRSDVLRLHGGDGLAVGGETDDRIGVGVIGDRPVNRLAGKKSCRSACD